MLEVNRSRLYYARSHRLLILPTVHPMDVAKRNIVYECADLLKSEGKQHWVWIPHEIDEILQWLMAPDTNTSLP